MRDELLPFFAGLSLAGQRLPNGQLKGYIGNPTLQNQTIDNWPDEIRLYHNTYTLENVIKGKNGYECAVYA